MGFRGHKIAGAVFLTFLVCVPSASPGQKKRDKEKIVWNYAGGVLFETDGTLPNGVCFRIYGRMSADNFFDNLKRFDTDQGPVFRRGSETVTHFPDELLLSFAIHDQLCPPGYQRVGARSYLTREMMSSLKLSLYWKRGVDLRTVGKVTQKSASIEPIVPYARNLYTELPKRFEWSYQWTVPSSGVPLTDSLVFVFRGPDGRIAARVAARL